MKHLLIITISLLAWSAPGPAVRAGTADPAEPLPVWRFWSPVYGKHFYTLDAAEKDWLLTTYPDVWTYEGVAYRAFAPGPAAPLRVGADPNTMPVYRFWSGSLHSHFYTLDAGERDKLINNHPTVWTYEGVAFSAYPTNHPPAGTMPVYRFWSGSRGGHFYTTSDSERFKLLSGFASVWQYEGVAWYAYPPDAAAPAAIIKGPYVQQATKDATTIMWETDIAGDGRVDYGTVAPDEFSANDPALVARHRVVLSGLHAGTTYSYQVSSGGTVSPAGSFTTAPPAGQPFRFAVYGDSRSYPTTHARVVRNLVSDRPAIVFHTGDLVSNGTEYSLWQTEFFEPAHELLLRAPIVPVPGNHEYAGTGPLWFSYFFDQPLDRNWWSLTYGNARFIGLDTNADYAAGSPQHAWLLEELASAEYADAAWHVVLFHYPAFTATAAYADTAAVREHLVPLFEQSGVDLVFAGHSHTYERYENNGVCYIVTAGGGAPLYPLAPDILPPIRQFGLTAYHHCTVDVDPVVGSLTLRAIDLAGHVFDTVSLSQTR